MEGRVLLNITRYRQKKNECAVASAASLANYYDASINYKETRRLISEKKRLAGLHTSQQARLLNDLGYDKVTIVTFDLDIVDFSWSELPKEEIIEKLKRVGKYYQRINDRSRKFMAEDLADWLSDEDCDNNLKIDSDLAMYIKRSLNSGRPVGASFNWTSMFKSTKAEGRISEIAGNPVSHAVVIRGYDDEGVFIVDSNCNYDGRLRKYRRGYYKLPWHRFLVNIARTNGDLILINS